MNALKNITVLEKLVNEFAQLNIIEKTIQVIKDIDAEGTIEGHLDDIQTILIMLIPDRDDITMKEMLLNDMRKRAKESGFSEEATEEAMKKKFPDIYKPPKD